ncbi:WXG100 family type VII secretion target [Gandjariella thermophila]|nr:PPE domain-containing protein [Gandjariella thermophila]
MAPVGTDYRGFSHPELKQMVTENMDPGHVHDVGRAWNDLGNTMVQFSQDLNTAIASSRQSWQGQAAEAAHGYLSTLGNWTGQTGQGMQLMGNRMAVQAEAASTAKNSMPEPVNFSVNDALRMVLTERNPFDYPKLASQIEQKFDEKNQAHEQAAQVMTAMARSLHDSGSTMPAFAAPPAPQDGGGQPGGGQPGGGGGPGTGGGGRWPGWQVDGPGGRSGGVVGPGGSAQGGPYSGGASIFGVPAPGDQTSAQGWAPTDAGTPGYPGGSGGYPGGYPGGSGDSRFTSGLVGGLPGGFSPGAEPEGLARGRAAGGVGGRSAVGGGSVGRPGTGGNRFGPGASAGALAAEEAAAARGGAAGGRGAAGAGGMGGAGAGGRAGRDGDTEHHRPSYLVEGDPEGLFGADQLTVPPVIGE